MSVPLNVLVVEDNVINQKVVVRMLERLGLSPAVALNGREAVQAATTRPFDLILMDVQMPEMDGLEATKALRTPGAQAVRSTIIALTANAMTGDRERCLDAGMDDYLAKPLKQQELELTLRKWFPSFQPPQAGPAPEPLPMQPLIDPKRLDQIREIGDPGLIKELLQLYLQDLEQYTEEVREALAAGNFARIYESSHKLKGSSANLGVETLRSSCILMEGYARAADRISVDAHFSIMQEQMDEIRDYITVAHL
ncbi:MAG: response regulator [Bacteroidetes bacterium]|nr:response regulator [Bacteroidota bacterium]